MKQITTDDLRRMEDQEGLILQGCGGDPQEWVDGINDLLTETGILLNGSTFQAENISVFRHGELINMLFPFERVELAVSKLAMWRIQTHGQFGGTWLSDFVVAKSALLLLLSPRDPLRWARAGAPLFLREEKEKTGRARSKRETDAFGPRGNLHR